MDTLSDLGSKCCGCRRILDASWGSTFQAAARSMVSTFKVWTTWMLLALLTIWQQPQTHQVLKLMKHW
jgi:hypothetical protein